jgi:SAM-dependent methyltransferase
MRTAEPTETTTQATTELPDLSENFTDPEIAARQRTLVAPQLEALRAGEPPRHFRILANAFARIARIDGTPARPLRVLDAGCGSAYYSEVLRHLIPWPIEYTGADFNAGMLTLAREKYAGIQLVQSDIRSLEFGDRAFEVVITGAVIVHVKEWQQAVHEVGRVADRWLILHRTLVREEPPTIIRKEHLYDADLYRVYIHEPELLACVHEMGYTLVQKTDCGEGVPRPDCSDLTYLFVRTPAARSA